MHHHPLDDSKLKITRTVEQFDSLRSEIAKFDKANPYRLRGSIDPETGDEVFECADPPPFPRRWGVLVGELIHNLRSALDYMVVALVTEAGRKPNRDTAFPIAKTKSRYLRKNRRKVSFRDRRLKGLSESLKRRIDSLQPFEHGDLAYANILLALADLTNRDKHQALHPAYTWVATKSRGFSFPTDDEMRNLEIRILREGGFSVKADFKRGPGIPARVIMYPDVQVQEPGIEVVFGTDPSRLFGLEEIRDMIQYVDWIVRSFEDAFGSSVVAA